MQFLKLTNLCIISSSYWASFFTPRNVITYAIYPSIIVPTHFFGEPGYISDTENTVVVNNNFFEAEKLPDVQVDVINNEQENFDHRMEL